MLRSQGQNTVWNNCYRYQDYKVFVHGLHLSTQYFHYDTIRHSDKSTQIQHW